MPAGGGPLGFTRGGGASVGAPSSTGSDHRLGANIGAGTVTFELPDAGADVSICPGAASVTLGLPAVGSRVVGKAGRAGAEGGWSSASGTLCGIVGISGAAPVRLV